MKKTKHRGSKVYTRRDWWSGVMWMSFSGTHCPMCYFMVSVPRKPSSRKHVQ